MERTPLQDRLFADLVNKAFLVLARAHAFQYLDTIGARHVQPAADAVDVFSVLDEPFPRGAADANFVVEQLHAYGSPTTVATTGGRFFGLVTGGALPASMGVRWFCSADLRTGGRAREVAKESRLERQFVRHARRSADKNRHWQACACDCPEGDSTSRTRVGFDRMSRYGSARTDSCR